MPSNHIYAVHEDVNGFIWVCTQKGVSKFDGDRFTNFTTKDGLPTNDLWNILEDSKNRMWLHFRGHELCYIQHDSINLVPLDFDCEGSVLFEHNDTIKVFNDFTNQIYSLEKDTILRKVQIYSLYNLLNIYLESINSEYSVKYGDRRPTTLNLGDQVLESIGMKSNASIQESIVKDSVCAFRFQISNDDPHIFMGKRGYHKLNLTKLLGQKVE